MKPEENSAAYLLDVHKVQQIYLTYALSMDSHQWDLMDQCFLENAEVRLSALARHFSKGVEVVDRKTWKAVCREADVTFDALQHFIYPPLIKIENGVAYTRVYYVAQHAKNALAPDAFFTLGGWYNGELVKQGDDWRISKHALIDLWFSGNPAVMGLSVPAGGLPREEGHRVPAWLK